jgi:hypothetical protein
MEFGGCSAREVCGTEESIGMSLVVAGAVSFTKVL